MSQQTHTPVQVQAVRRVRRCKPTAFYEILDLKVEASDGEVKKSYRRLALIMHPDKNNAPGADEAFKMISRAFQVLSDPQKRAAFDSSGQDPESRMNAGPSPFSGRGSSMFQEEVSAEDLFNMFFGGGGGMNGFGGSPFSQGASFSFGGPGVRVHRFGGMPQTRQRATTEPSEPRGGLKTLLHLLPLLLVFGGPLLMSLFSGDSTDSLPTYSLTPSPPYTRIQYTPQHNVPYYIQPNVAESLSSRKLSQLGNRAEITYTRGLQVSCEREYNERQRLMDASQGWFSIDYEKYNAATRMKLESCDRLRQMGYHN